MKKYRVARMRSGAGFTAIEAVLAIVAIAILIGIGVAALYGGK